jgi:hypothetical protein
MQPDTCDAEITSKSLRRRRNHQKESSECSEVVEATEA